MVHADAPFYTLHRGFVPSPYGGPVEACVMAVGSYACNCAPNDLSYR